MRGTRSGVLWAIALTAVAVTLLSGPKTYADLSTSTNYRLDTKLGASIGGVGSSTNYALVATGGQSVIGGGASGSYKLSEGYSSHLQKSIEVAAQPSGLIAYYPLDEPGGTVAYDAGLNSLNATSTDTPPRQTGLIGGALSPMTSGSGQYLSTAPSSLLDVSTFTVCSWVYKTGTETNPVAVARSNGGSTQDGMWVLGTTNTYKTKFVIQANGTSNVINSSGSISQNAWQQICGTYDGSTMKLYNDGVLDTATPLSATLPSVSSQPLTIGARSNGSGIATAMAVDEVKLFNRVLSDDEIKALYDAGTAGVPSGLSFGTVIGGTPRTTSLDVSVQADGTGYDLAVNQNQALTSGANTIPAVSGSIASPASWTDGTTKGLGFTLASTTATPIAAKWSSGSAYAAIPSPATTFYSRDGSIGASRDLLTMRFKLDVGAAQAMGSYSNQVTITGTVKP